MPEPIVSLNEEALRDDLRELVRRTVEELLNGLLEEEAGDLVGAERYERTAEREAYRAGHYDRKLATTSGEVTLRMPKLKGVRFTTAIIERCRRRETSVEEAMIETCLAGVPTRRIEDVSEALWGSSVSASTVSSLSEKAFKAVERWRSRPLERAYPYVYVGRHLPQAGLGRQLRERGGDGRHRRRRRRLPRGDRHRRGPRGVARSAGGSSCRGSGPAACAACRMFTGDEAAGMVGSIAEVLPGGRLPAAAPCTSTETCWPGCPRSKRPRVGRHAQGDPRDGVARGGRGQGPRRRRGAASRSGSRRPPRWSGRASPRR